MSEDLISLEEVERVELLLASSKGLPCQHPTKPLQEKCPRCSARSDEPCRIRVAIGLTLLDEHAPALLAAAHEAHRLREALRQIANVRAIGPHVSAPDGMPASLEPLNRCRIIAWDALREPGDG